MVYKKIISNIPSLSSLLLAGMVLGGGCPTKQKNSDAPVQAPVSTGESEGGKADGSGKSEIDPFLKVAYERIYNLLVDCTPLSHLKNKPLTVSLSEFTGPSAKNTVETLFKSFLGNSYPQTLRNVFAPLGDFTFRSDASGISGGKYKHKVAYGTAMNQIAKIWEVYSDIFGKMLNAIRGGAYYLDMQALADELEKFYLDNVEPATGTPFRSNQIFSDSKKEVKLLPGQKLAKLMSQSSQAKPHSLSPIMGKSIQNLWVKLKNSVDTGTVKADAASAPLSTDAPTYDILQERGAGIIGDATANLNPWMLSKVVKMPNIQALSNGEDVKDFNLATGLSSSTVSHASDAAKVEDVSFGTLMFTLFRGQGVGDLFNLDVLDTTKRIISFDTKDEAFQRLRTAAVGDKNAFADYLGKHIMDNKLDSLFVIPDVAPFDAIIDDVQLAPNEAANFGAASSGAAVVDNSVTHRLFKSILETYEAGCSTGTAVGDLDKITMLAKVIRPVSPDTAASMKSANLTFVQRVCAHLAAALVGGTLEESSKSVDPQSGEQLLNAVRNIIDNQLNYVIVQKKGSEYLSTKTTVIIGKCIEEFANQLSKKDGAASITYDTIKKDTGGKFDIAVVLEAMKSDYRLLQSLLKVQVDPVLSIKTGPGTVDYKHFFNIPGLIESHYPALDKIRLEYIQSKKSQ